MKSSLARWSLSEKLWLVVLCVLVLFISRSGNDSIFETAVFLSGALCAVLAARGSLYTFLFGCIFATGTAYAAYLLGELSLAILCLAVFLPLIGAGYWWWSDHSEQSIVHMRRLPLARNVQLALICFFAIIVLGAGLNGFSTVKTPFVAAACCVLATTSMILLVRRYRDLWYYFMLLNVVMLVVWTLRTGTGVEDGALQVLTAFIFLGNALYGLSRWSRRSRNNIVDPFPKKQRAVPEDEWATPEERAAAQVKAQAKAAEKKSHEKEERKHSHHHHHHHRRHHHAEEIRVNMPVAGGDALPKANGATHKVNGASHKINGVENINNTNKINGHIINGDNGRFTPAEMKIKIAELKRQRQVEAEKKSEDPPKYY